MTKNDLDKRICDVEPGTKNTGTYREFIRKSEKEFGMAPEPIDEFEDKKLQEYLDWLDELWGK
ncbi:MULTISPECIES: hypothetical protein [Clostridium]|mgnify:CR=1 FL=1|uniref:Uncharacterized protein n=1 Tax=Clostridium lapidicellarium TaxID=3240931 RepID=A0ABV4DY32_9CLOT